MSRMFAVSHLDPGPPGLSFAWPRTGVPRFPARCENPLALASSAEKIAEKKDRRASLRSEN